MQPAGKNCLIATLLVTKCARRTILIPYVDSLLMKQNKRIVKGESWPNKNITRYYAAIGFLMEDFRLSKKNIPKTNEKKSLII